MPLWHRPVFTNTLNHEQSISSVAKNCNYLKHQLSEMKYYLALTICIITFSAKAQYIELNEVYEKETIYFVGRGKFSLNGQTYKIKNLEEHIYKSPEAYDEYKQYMKKSGNGSLLSLLTLGLSLSSFAVIEKNSAMSVALLGASVIPAVFAIRLGNQSSKHLYKSVWLYNRDVLGEYY